MAPRTRASRLGGRAGRQRGGRSAVAQPDDGIPAVYREMMNEAGDSGMQVDSDGSRPRKRPRRAGERMERAPVGEEKEKDDVRDIQEIESSPIPPERPLYTVEDDSESDLEFEDVELGGASAEETDTLPEPMKGQEEGFSVVARRPEANTPSKARRRRKPVTSAERLVRLAIHKMHILYLLYHVFYRNHWCNDEVAQTMLKQIVPPRIIQQLNPDPRASQAQSSSFFLFGLNQISDLFHARFKILSLGLRRPQWLAEKEDLANFKLHEGTEKPLELSDFRRTARSLQGSADLGAQLFCCLLRAVGVEARLVCSLQPLGFASAAEVGPAGNVTPATTTTLYLLDSDDASKAQTDSATNGSTENAAGPTPGRITRIGQPRNSAIPEVSRAPVNLSETPVRINRPSYPVFWVEAFNSAHQKWIAVDPLATHTVNKPSRLEPGLNDPKNCMTYVIAFEDNGVARDVTRRYTKAYTAKTRKLRVETTAHGTTWLRKALRIFRRHRMLDRDQLEDAELTAKEASEGMPRNVQDFKNHPLYALERHLKRNEIIHPKQESGRINVGTVNHPKFESVYRRSNVHVVKSADKWFRLGREIRIGEQPLKHAIPRRGTRVRESPLDPETVEDVGVGLYAVFQTQVYLPPPVVDGKVPKNQYGNIDIFVPSMIPEGGVWIRMPEAKHAAKLLKVDYADAVTGFDFKGRHGTARIDGVVVAEEHHEAIEIVCDALKDAAQEEKEDGRRREALKLWRKFLVGMREVRRIEGYLRDNGGDTETVHGDEEGIQQNKSADGGFDNAASSKLTRRHFFDDGGGFLAEEDYRDGGDVGGGFFAESDDGDDESDGFVPEEETVTEEDFNDGDSDGGGFVPEKDESKEVAEAVEDSEEVPAIEGTSEASAEDAGPFGFANIRIPAQSRSILNVEDSRMPSLPRVIKGMRRSSHVKAVQEQSMLIEDDVTPTHSRIDKAIADLATARDTEPSIPADSKPSVTESTGECVPEQQAQKESSNSWLGPETTVPTETETNKMTEQDAKPALHQQEEPPPSSYEYDEDMPLDDPEDEDAEPEWLV